MDKLQGDNCSITRSPLRSVGSKGRLIQNYNLMDYFPKVYSYHFLNDKGVEITHRRIYVELFCGSAIMFFNLDPTPLRAVLNDSNNEIFNFWTVIKNKHDDFIKELEYTWCGQSWIDELASRTDAVGRALSFYVRNRYSNLFTIPERFPKEVDFSDWKEKMDKCRLHVWNLDYKDALERINKMKFKEKEFCNEFLIFEDPPYHGTESFYKKEFTDKDHETLARLNHETTHNVILTYNDDPFIRELYKDWHLIELKNYTKLRNKYNDEIMLSNRPLIRKQRNKQGMQQKVI